MAANGPLRRRQYDTLGGLTTSNGSLKPRSPSSLSPANLSPGTSSQGTQTPELSPMDTMPEQLLPELRKRKQSSPMMPAFMVSAPGKVIVYGEHAVVHGKVRVTPRPIPQLEEPAESNLGWSSRLQLLVPYHSAPTSSLQPSQSLAEQ